MSSTLKDGKAEPHNAGNDSNSPDIPHETRDATVIESTTDEAIQNVEDDVDTLPELELQDHNRPDDEDDGDTEKAASLTRLQAQSDNQSPAPPSVDDSASIPDDTPSIQNSGLSSPRSDTHSTPPAISRKGAAASRRPFERRFQSRLSSSYLGSPRSGSPAFLGSHSRQSSLASFGPPSDSATEGSAAPWEVIRWNRLKRLTGQAFSEVGRRNFGSPTCLCVTDQVVIGTSRGLVLVFDHQQNHKAIIGSGTPASESGPVTSLAISADHTTVAAGHGTGHIFTWEIGRAAKPFMHIPSVDATQATARKNDGHLQGSAVLHVGFLGYRRTALVSADDKGMAFSHLASRGTGPLGRTVRTTRILGRYPEVLIRRGEKPIKKSSVLAFSPLPLGNVEQGTDAMGLVAMLTPYLLVIVSTTPVAQTQHKAARPKEVAAHSAMTAALAWFPAIKLKGNESQTSNNKLVYAWSNVLTVLEVHEMPQDDDSPKDKPPELQFLPRSRFQAEEAIVAVQWMSRSVLGVLTITQQLLIIEDVTMTVSDSFDLLPKNLYHADLYSHQLEAIVEHHDETDTSMHGVVADGYDMSFRAYKGRLYLLGFNDIWWGALTNWADRLYAMLEIGDFIGAVRLATAYYSGKGEKLTIGLPEDDQARRSLVHDRLVEMMGASLKYAFGKNEQAAQQPRDSNQLTELAVACVAACLKMDEQDFLFDEVFTWYEDNECGVVFVEVLEPHILDRQITVLPPPAVKTLINHFSSTHSASKLEEIICLLDATAMDIDQVTTMCKRHGLYDAYIYVWNTALLDYISPLKELVGMLPTSKDMNGHAKPGGLKFDVSSKLFAYLSFALTGRVYPIGEFMDDDRSTSAKMQLYELLFSGNDRGTVSFPLLRRLLHIDTASLMGVLNEAFEDAFLNSTYDNVVDGVTDPMTLSSSGQVFNRQMIVQILLEVMSSGFSAEDVIFLDMFIARNLPKYSQYMRLNDTTLGNILKRFCNYADEDLHEDIQLSVEYLLQVYKPPYMDELIPLLAEAKFFRALKSIFRKERQWADLVMTYFKESAGQEQVFDVILECLRVQSSLTELQRHEVGETVKSHANELIDIDVEKTASLIDLVLPDEHELFLQYQTDRPRDQFRYLHTLLEPKDSTEASVHLNKSMIENYVKLMCQFNPAHVVEYIQAVKPDDLRLDQIIPSMEISGNIDAAVILLTRQGHAREGMDRLIKHLSTLQAALAGILQNASTSPDAVVTNEAIEDLLESIDKYARVGIWLCENQAKDNHGSRSKAKSPMRSSMQQSLTFEDDLWLDFLVSIVAVAQEVTPLDEFKSRLEDGDEISSKLRTLIQDAFTSLLAITSASRSGPRADDFAFLRILRAFLTRAAETSASLSQLRLVIASIFSAYSYEEALLSLSNAMLDKDLFVQVDEVSRLRQMGWRPRGQTCEICRRRVWGPGTGIKVWEAWRKGERQKMTKKQHPQVAVGIEEEDNSRGKGKAAEELSSQSEDEEDAANGMDAGKEFGAIVVFSCRHIYHRRCLQGSQQLGGNGDTPALLQEPTHLKQDAQSTVRETRQGSAVISVRLCLIRGLRRNCDYVRAALHGIEVEEPADVQAGKEPAADLALGILRHSAAPTHWLPKAAPLDP